MTSGRDATCARCGVSLVDATLVAAGQQASAEQFAAPPARNFAPPSAPPSAYGVPQTYASPAYFPPTAPPRRKRLGVMSIAIVLIVVTSIAAIVGLVVFRYAAKAAATAEVRNELRAYLARQPNFTAMAEGKAGDSIVSGKMVQDGDRLYLTSVQRGGTSAGRNTLGLLKVVIIIQKGG
jgi:hypothetical protein